MKSTGAAHIFLNILKQQFQANDPAFVRPTLQRLTQLGYADETARRMMAGIVANLMAESIESDTPFDTGKYEALLNALPLLPR